MNNNVYECEALPQRDVAGYLLAVRKWIRTGERELAPNPSPYGLQAGDVSDQYFALWVELRNEYGMSNWNFYSPEFMPLMREIRQIAHELRLDPDLAAAEFVNASSDSTSPRFTAGRKEVLEKYRQLICDGQTRSGLPAFMVLYLGR